jgi:sensor domain CHASE-containing protein
VLTLTATKLMWQTAIGTLAWFALLAAAIYAAVYVYRASREY